MITRNSASRILSYILCGLITTVLCGYLFFPTDKVRIYLEKTIDYWSPSSVCRIGKAELLFPLHLRFENIQIQKLGEGNDSTFVLDAVEFSPGLKFWQKIKVNGELYAGLFQTELHHRHQKEMFELAKIRVEDVDVAEIIKNISSWKRNVTGEIRFSGSYEAKYTLPLNGSIKGNAELIGGSLELKRPVLSLTTLNFEKVISSVNCDATQCRLSEGEILGEEIDASFSGELSLSAPLLMSRLQLSGFLDPRESFFKTHPQGDKMVRQLLHINKSDMLPFTVGGTLQWPTFRLSM